MLGPEKLPRVVSEVGRWVGRARAMARQFREQLEEEVQLEQARKARQAAPPPPADSVATAASHADASATHSPAGGNDRAPGVNAESAQSPSSTDHAGATATDPSAARPTQAAGADERRT